ncbi:tyrosinase-like [Pyxicephalus adspersus]|uniref:tyrosinase-like n=1 Tax=Pyxicephalus adspersus TaxID=30357 RepID=UPI003B5C1CEE
MKKSIFIATFILLYVASVNGFLFFRECVEGVTSWPTQCCPLFQGSVCGENQGRGYCAQKPYIRTVGPVDVTYDERYNSPGFLFNWTCQCNPRFIGADCGICYPGWTGANCDQPHMVYRQDIKKMSPQQVQRFIATLHYGKTKIMKDYVILSTADRFRRIYYKFLDASCYDLFDFLHNYATRPFNSGAQEFFIINYAHGSTGFFSWHRYCIVLLEKVLQMCSGDNDFAFPFWRWELETNCSVCNNDYVGATDIDGKISKYSVFSEWRLICGNDYSQTVCLTEECACQRERIVRLPGLNSARLPTINDVQRCLSMPYYDTAPYNRSSINSARQCLESLHNTVHVYFGGIMNQVHMAAGDPIFFLHHVNVDRMFDEYIVQNNLRPENYPPTNVYGHGPTSCIDPLFNCVQHRQMLQPISNLGVTYKLT